MTDDQNRRTDALDNLTDALCEDILKAPGEELLAEVAEDYGDRRALAMGFDRIFARVQQDAGRLDGVSRIGRIIFAIRKSGISLLARKKEAPSTQNERLSLLGARDWQGTHRQATVHSSRTTQEWFASREFSASIREVDSPTSGRGQAVYLSEEFQPLARCRTLQDHTQTPQSDELFQRIQGYQRVEFQRQRRRLMAYVLVFLAFVATAGIFGYHSLTTPVMIANPSDQKEFAEMSGRRGEKTRFDFGPAGSQLGGNRLAFYQVEPVIKAEQAPTNRWAPGPTNWSLGGEFLAKVVPAPTTGTPAANSGNYVVQLASQRSEDAAHASFKILQQKYPSILGGYQATIRADLADKVVYYRAQIGTFATLEQAWGLCSSLKSTGAQCIVQDN